MSYEKDCVIYKNYPVIFYYRNYRVIFHAIKTAAVECTLAEARPSLSVRGLADLQSQPRGALSHSDRNAWYRFELPVLVTGNLLAD